MDVPSDKGVLPPERWPGLRAHLIDPNGIVHASRGYTLLSSNDFGASWAPGPSIRPSLSESMVRPFNLGIRLLRGGIHGLTITDDGSLVAIARKGIWRAPTGENQMRRVFRIDRGSRPLNLCSVPGGILCFGEYFANRGREALHIYGSWDNGKTFEPVYTFPSGSVRHIHGLFHDPFRHGIWILTGDESDESRFLFASEDFQQVDVVLQQGQLSRAVIVVIHPDGLYYGTDTPLEQNYLCFYEESTSSLHRLGQLPSSCFSSCRVGDKMYFECVAEPSEVNADRTVSLWALRGDGEMGLHASWERDYWPAPLFQFGRMSLARGPNPSPYLFASGTAVQGADNTLLRWG